MALTTTDAIVTYMRAIDDWNRRDAGAMADCFSATSTMIGFDGSLASGSRKIRAHLESIFADHPTPPYVVRITDVRVVVADVVLVRSEVGMVPPGQDAITPAVNAIQSCVLCNIDNEWLIDLLQSTPAGFHGRPHLVEEMTARLEATRNTIRH